MFNWNPSINAEQTSLAKFITEQSNDPLLQALKLESKRKHLPSLGIDEFVGYDKGIKQVWVQVHAIYDTILTHEPQFKFSTANERTTPLSVEIHTINEILKECQVNYIDLVILLSSLLLNVGLNPMVIVLGNTKTNTPTYLLLGFWLQDFVSKDVKIDEKFILSNINSIGLFDTSLITTKNTFQESSSKGYSYLPYELRTAFPLIELTKKQIIPKQNQDFNSILYGVDLRKYINDYYKFLPIIAIMGAKGGVGKTIISARLGEMIAESKTNVLIIDYDIENAGSTILHEKRIEHGLPNIKTVYDHLIQYTEGFSKVQIEKNITCWDITPFYLLSNNLGNVYLIPARGEHDLLSFDIIANIDYKERNSILEKVTNELLSRSSTIENLGCIIIDCGAGTNPVFSTALYKSRYPIIVATPEDVCIKQIDTIKSELKFRYPKSEPGIISIILNRVRDETDKMKWSYKRPKGFISESQELQADYYKNQIFFDLGYDTFSSEIRDALSKIFLPEDQRLVPNEYFWIKRWIDVIIIKQFPTQLRKEISTFNIIRRLFIFVSLILLGLTVAFFIKSMLADSTHYIFSINNWNSIINQDIEVPNIVVFIRIFGVLLILVAISLLFKLLLKYKVWKQRLKLVIKIENIAKSNDDKALWEYIKNSILDSELENLRKKQNPFKYFFNPDKKSLGWLRAQLDIASSDYRKEERKSRIDVNE